MSQTKIRMLTGFRPDLVRFDAEFVSENASDTKCKISKSDKHDKKKKICMPVDVGTHSGNVMV
jgi:hypothetical protein